jgi:hypothetical protein
VDTSRTEEPSSRIGEVPEDSSGGATSFMVTLSDPSTRPDTPTKRKRAVTRPPMTAETSAVSAVFRVYSFRNYYLECVPLLNGDAVQLPFPAFVDERPRGRVALGLFGERSYGNSRYRGCVV